MGSKILRVSKFFDSLKNLKNSELLKNQKTKKALQSVF
jgi:hypothetical protein